jgi:aspartyl-tRNA(Asn)/glutamyl-tRNA(Gln) amidotransferase subunit A
MLLQDLGAQVAPLRLPHSFDEYGALCGDIIAPEAYANWQTYADNPASGLAAPIRTRMLSGKVQAAAYIQTIRRQSREIQDFLAVMDRFDAIVLPTIPFPAIPVAEVDETKAPMAAHTRWVNYLNLAGLAIPTAVSKSGLPMSLQIVVRHMDDCLALRIGRAFEVRRGRFPSPPG